MSAALGLIVAAERLVVCRRSLPVPGEVLVAAGEHVAAEQVVARATRPGPLLPVPLAGWLGCEPSEIGRALCVAPGQAVRAGEVLGRTPGVWGLGARVARSPITGTVAAVSPASGQLVLRGEPSLLALAAHIPGVVREIYPGEGVLLQCPAAHVQGVYGAGGEVRGLLAAEPRPGAVWLCRTAGEGALRRAVAAGVAAVVTGGAPYAELAAAARCRPGLAVVLTEGFGALPMGTRAWEILSRHLGRPASVDGTTQIRAGVVRPEVVVPLAGEVRLPPPAPLPVLRPGARVRLVRAPDAGRRGVVVQLPPLPRAVASEAVVLVALVALDGGGLRTVPRANLEVEG